MGRLLVHLVTGPENPTRAALALLVARTALESGHAVDVFVAGDGVAVLRPETLEAGHGIGTGSLREHLDALVAGGVTIHASGMSSKARGLTPTAYLAKLGLLGPHVLGAHGVWLGPDDIRLVAATRTSISHNPESNMKLASGTAPVPDYVAAGVAIGLGTDGAASNNDLDMFEAMRQAAFLQKVTRNDPTTTPAPLVLEMATRRGAEAIDMGDRLGQLTSGRRADVIVVDTRAPHLQPMFDPIAQVVYAAKGSDVRTTIVNGRVLMHDRVVKTLQAAAVIADAQRMAERVRTAVR